MLFTIRVLMFVLTFTTASFTIVGTDEFMAGPVIKNYGKHDKVQQNFNFDKNSVFKVDFDMGEQGK
jgi:hypothetical protein